MSVEKRRLEWRDDLASGDVALDAHNRDFLRQSNDFLDQREGPERYDKLESILGFLTDYSKNHFAAQESMMVQMKYPGTDEHKAEHKAFIKKMSLLYKQLLIQKRPKVQGDDDYDPRGLDGVVNDAGDFILDWYDSHLLRTDKRLSDYLKFEHSKHH